MSNFFLMQMFVRYTGTNGETVEIPWDTKVSWEEAWAAAHQNEDGSPPNPKQCASSTIWAFAMAIREAEDKLRALAASTE